MANTIEMKTLTINGTTFEVVDRYSRDNKPNAVIDDSSTGAGHLEFNNTDLYPKTLLNQIQTIDELKGLILNTFYPVGTIYMSTTSADPSTYLGGTWQAWGSGRVPCGVDTSVDDFSTVEKAGGALTRTLQVSDLPQHSHTMAHTHTFTTGTQSNNTISGYYAGHSTAAPHTESNYFHYLRKGSSKSASGVIDGATTAAHTHSGTTNASSAANTGTTGSGTAFSIIQPYITCYMWKRIS